MDSTADELDLMFARAVEAAETDLVAVDTLTSIIRANKELAHRLSEKIGKGLHSRNATEVVHVIDVLENCMTDSNDLFRTNIGRFQFLNEIVKLISPNHANRPPPPDIRDRIMDLMLIWTCQYPHLSKIKEAYSMLRKQGVPHTPVQDHRLETRLAAEVDVKKRPLNTLFDEIPKHLLTSTNPADVQAAKLLIEKALEREKRQDEVRLKYGAELKEAAGIATVLGELLDAYENGGSSEDESSLIGEMYEQCRTKQITVSIYALDPNNQELAKSLLTNDMLQEVMQRYTTIIVNSKSNPTSIPTSTNILTTPKPISNADLLTSIMHQESPTTLLPSPSKPVLNIPLTDPLAGDLDDIFLQPIRQTAQTAFSSHLDNDLLMMHSSSTSSTSSLPSNVPRAVPSVEVGSAVLQPKVIGKIVPATTNNENPKGGESKSGSSTDFFGLDSTISGLKMSLAQKEAPIADVPKDVQLNDAPATVSPPDDEDCSLLIGALSVKPATPAPTQPLPPAGREIPLSELVVDIEHIQPSGHPPKVIMDDANGLKVVLHFAQDRPRADVAVIVVITTNQSAEPVSNYQLDASVSKPNKIRLLAASGRDLPAKKPFRPPTEDITQVLLLAHNSTNPLPRITCIVGYVLGNDPDPIKESVTIDDLPL